MRFSIYCAIVGVCTMLSACSSSEKDIIKIGFIGPLSGEESSVGLDLLRGTELAFRMANEAGFIPRAQVQLVAEDGQCNTEVAVPAMLKLVRSEQVTAVIGSICPEVARALSRIAEREQVALLIPPSNSAVAGGSATFMVEPTAIRPTVDSDEARTLQEIFERTYGQPSSGIVPVAYGYDLSSLLLSSLKDWDRANQTFITVLQERGSYTGVMSSYQLK